MTKAAEHYQAGLRLNREGQPEEAIALFQEAAADGYGPACFAMASVLATHQFTDLDPVAARSFLQRGYANGDHTCGLSLSSFMASGYGGDRSWPEATRVLSQLAYDGDRVAVREIALLNVMTGRSRHASAGLAAAARDTQTPGDVFAKSLLLASMQASGDHTQKAATIENALTRANVPIALLSHHAEFSASDLEVETGTNAIDVASDVTVGPFSAPTPQIVARDPHISITPRGMSPVICDYLTLSAFPSLQPARIIDPSSGQVREDPYRTGATMTFSPMQQTPTAIAVRQLLCACAGADLERAELLSVIAYQEGQEYRPHFDSFLTPSAGDGPQHDEEYNAGGQRTHTVLLNLNERCTGGATRFPELDIEIPPRIGQIITFTNVDDAGQRHPQSLHVGAKVMSGVKFLASQWIRERRYEPTPATGPTS